MTSTASKWTWQRIFASFILAPFIAVVLLVLSPFIIIAALVSALDWIFCTALGISSKDNPLYGDWD